jgi:hypothetical protein
MALLALSYLIRQSRNGNSPIDIEDLLLERGPDGTKQLSKIAFYLLGAFLVSSWVVVYQLTLGTLTDVTFGAYLAAWVAPLITKIVKNGHAEQPK